MGYETISEITGNIETALKNEGLNVTRKALDSKGSLPAGLMPLAQVSYNGESFESPFGERPSYSEASFTIKIILPEQPDCPALIDEQMWAHQARQALTDSALNSGELALAKPVTGVRIPGFSVESDGGFSKISMDVKVRYRES
ncbi:MAG: hypothetical protein HYV23_08700 [Deltaproteobacteria bacterium]|nr:hypothetical protein [Deltaproteobacteria bacterium]